MNIYIVREQDMFELWGRDYNQPERGFFMAYLEEKKLIGAEHNYKYECKQLRATVRYLHRKIDKLQTQRALLRALCDVYLNAAHEFAERIRRLAEKEDL